MLKPVINLFLLLLFIITGNACAQNAAIIGQWQTIDDETGKPKSIVQIDEQAGKVYGKIVQLFRKPEEDPNPVCHKCTDYRKNQKVIGMVILEQLEPKNKEWSGGKILDPANGKIYDCKIWLEQDQLKVRGYLGLFFRTQTWQRVK
ncbi:hypothetical protein THII_0965 [Thioploca ingrica]|uniref:DUF2147 domain-containing protein n=1 Tax=Thioploca ingrica TaxID=40754 RepID=A0A090AIM7_9GAMM|nr:hypothetical protein THII_0965 [Thioploca ingrica]